MTNRERLEKVFKEAHDEGRKYVFVEIFMEGFPSSELIINHFYNILPKLDYYLKTYDENLKHKFSKGIRIVNFGYADDISDFEYVKHEDVE